MKSDKIYNVILECYRELFKNSTPVGDFDKLVEEAEINEFGQKIIPFMDYEICESKFYQILDETFKKHKIKKFYYSQIKTAIELGCSPKCKK
jgi:hypothetical protein